MNEYKIIGDITEIYIKDKVVLIDTEDLDKIKNNIWHINNHGYACYKRKSTVMLHSVVFTKIKGMDIDHINKNSLDNRKSNLRVVTHQENMRNMKKSKANTSGHTGVYLHPCGKWMPAIRHNGKSIHLGLYSMIEDAIKARKEAEIKYWGTNY